MNFKKVPFITFNAKNEDREPGDGPKEAHYKFELKDIVMGPIVEQPRDEDDSCDQYYTEDADVPDNDVLLQELANTKKDLTGVKSIHFDDSCKVPRFKLGEICGKQGIKVIRDRDKADAVIYGNDFTKSIFNNTSAGAFNYKDDFIKQAKKVKCKRNLITEIIPQLQAFDCDIVLLDDYDLGNGQENRLCVQKRIKSDSEASFDICYTEVSDESKYLMLTGNNNLIHQDVILEGLSSIIMDEEMHKSVCSMFESANTSDHIVAMEVMSNTAYRTSIVYLLDLMRRYYGSRMHQIHEKKNISFKAFREYINYEPSHTERSFDELIDVVIAKNALTESNYKLILKLLLEEEHKYMKEEDDARWVINSIDLAPEIKAKVIWDKKEELTLTEAL